METAVGHPRAVDVRLLEPQVLDVETLQRAFNRAGKERRRLQLFFDAVVREVDSLRRARRLTQEFSATKARERAAQLRACGVTSVAELIEKYQAMRKELEAALK